MDRMFSVEDMPETFWSTTESAGTSGDHRHYDSNQKGAMGRSDSEWSFEKFIRETTNGSLSSAIHVPQAPMEAGEVTGKGGGKVVEEEEGDVFEMVEDYNGRKRRRRIAVQGASHSLSPSYPPGKSCAPDPEFLKKQLDLACAAAAAAFCRTNGAKVQEPSPPPPPAEVTTTRSQELNSSPSPMASQALVNGSVSGVQKVHDKCVNGSGKPALSKAQNSVGQPQTRPLTSSSSREQTDEDELLSGAETIENLDPSDAKRVRRMISNRESARRSRRRKQAHLSELETHVSQLKGENSSLIEQLSDLNKKYHEACVNSRILKADVETMRAKVKMAEDMVKRMTCKDDPMFPAMPCMPPFSRNPNDASSNAPPPPPPVVVAVQEDPNQFLQTFIDITPESTAAPAGVAAGASPASKMGTMESMQRLASLEHLHERISGGPADMCGSRTTTTTTQWDASAAAASNWNHDNSSISK